MIKVSWYPATNFKYGDFIVYVEWDENVELAG